MTTKTDGQPPAYESFHIALHGTMMLLLQDGNPRSAEIHVPFNGCHQFVAACLDENGDVLPDHAVDLQRAVYILDKTLKTKTRLELDFPDPEHMTVTYPGAVGPYGWCKIAELPWPDQLLSWRYFRKSMLNASGQTYQNNGLDVVDLSTGIPMVYVLLYGPQDEEMTLKSRTIGDSLPIPATGGVGRLHIYAEAMEDMEHDALSTLNSCGHPPFDISIRSFVSNDLPSKQPPPDSTLASNEQRMLQEHFKDRNRRPLTKLSGLVPPFAVPSSTQNFGNPRTCTPLVAVNPGT